MANLIGIVGITWYNHLTCSHREIQASQYSGKNLKQWKQHVSISLRLGVCDCVCQRHAGVP